MSNPWSKVERWELIPGGWPPYQVSNLGRVRRVGRRTYGRVLKPRHKFNRHRIAARGYYSVRLWDREFLVHVLVAQAFLPPRPEGTEINHRDGDTANNKAENLEWATPSENKRHARAIGLQTGLRRSWPIWCKDGHHLTAATIYIRPSNGRRECRLCKTLTQRELRGASMKSGPRDGGTPGAASSG